MLVSDTSKITVKKIIEMGHELGMKIVAEGVETKEHLQALNDLQCDIAQGFFYSKPIPIDDLINWINNQFGKLENG
jgi:EAL domain-containing protein (putative c-di-GMP-specific phosphodiesterase class I)